MWVLLKFLLIHFWPWILIAGMTVFFFVSILLVARLEKYYIHQYEPVDLGTLPPPSRYFQAMNDAARTMDLRHCGDFVQSRGGSMYKCCLSLWLSADERTLLLVGGGKLARIDHKRTFFLSVIDSEKEIISVDDFGLYDLSGIREINVVFNADLAELNTRHQQRLASETKSPRSFSPTSCLQQYEDLERTRIEKLISLGLAEFLDLRQSVWRYNFKGAWASAWHGYWKGLQKAKLQADRQKKKRPGS